MSDPEKKPDNGLSSDVRTFFEVWRRIFAGQYRGADGIPVLTAGDIQKPQKKRIVVSAGNLWTRIVTNRPYYVSTPDNRQIDYFSGPHPGKVAADTSKPWNQAPYGAKLYAPGEWHLKTPLLPGDSEGDIKVLLVREAPSGFDSTLPASDILGPGAGLSGVDVRKIFGTDQTPFDFTGAISPVTWAKSARMTVNAADTSVFVANAARKAMAFFNDSTGGQKIALDVDTMTDVSGFIVLGPGVGKIFGKTQEGFTTQKIRAWSSAAGGVLVKGEAV